MSITLTQIQSFIPTDCSIDTTLLVNYGNIVSEEIDIALNNIFASPLATVLETDKVNYSTANTSGSTFISIGAWQEDGLTIKIAENTKAHTDTLTEDTLVLGTDYNLWYGWQGNKIIGKTLPVTRIQLLKKRLSRNEIVRVYGTYGWQAGYPNDVLEAIAQVAVELAGFAQSIANSGGVSGIKRLKSMTTEQEMSDNMAERLRTEARDVLANPIYARIINKYLLATESQISFV